MARKHLKPTGIAAALSVAVAGCATSPPHVPRSAASFAVASSNGSALGFVELASSGDGYRLVGTLQGLPAGIHGMHLHGTGVCTAPDFTSAGAHLNPQLRQHGSLNPAGTHLGDLPNLAVRGDGSARFAQDLPGTRAELDRYLFDSDGTALVIHASADDYLTDPSGNSGSRIACGTLRRQQ